MELKSNLNWSFHFYLMIWLIVASSSGSFQLSSPDNDHEFQPRIINGTVARCGKWPFMAYLKTSFFFTKNECGGTILNEDSILTSGHCLTDNNANQMTVYIGYNNINEVPSEYQFNVKSFIIHENYTYGVGKMYNDIGIVKLDRPINFQTMTRVSPVCIAISDRIEDEIDKLNCIGIGWGVIESGQNDDGQLREIKLPFRTNNQCARLTEHEYINETMMCAGYMLQHRGMCSGDSGGPLVCPYKDDPEMFTQVGVSSWCAECNVNPEPVYFARVSAYRDWINQNVRK